MATTRTGELYYAADRAGVPYLQANGMVYLARSMREASERAPRNYMIVPVTVPREWEQRAGFGHFVFVFDYQIDNLYTAGRQSVSRFTRGSVILPVWPDDQVVNQPTILQAARTSDDEDDYWDEWEGLLWSPEQYATVEQAAQAAEGKEALKKPEKATEKPKEIVLRKRVLRIRRGD